MRGENFGARVAEPAVAASRGAADSAAASEARKLALIGSRHFPAWLAEQRLSLAFTTHQAGKVFFIGVQPTGRLSIFERTFSRCTGLCVDGSSLWMSALDQLWRFENALGPGETHRGHDALYVPQLGYTTGDLDVHDIAIGADGQPIFVNTLFSCLAAPSPTHSFRPIWRPPFISRLAAEDRCHLNGLALANGAPIYVTAAGRSDAAGGWRDRRADGGIVIDVASGEIVAAGLSMPHSPRLYRDMLWVTNSGTGEFGLVDPESGIFEPVAFSPGYLRGLCFAGDFAIVGLSRPRDGSIFSGLALDGALARCGASPRCGLMIIDLRSGAIVHWLRIEGIVTEIYDVVALPGAVRSMALGFRSDEIGRFLTVEDGGNRLTAGSPVYGRA